MFFPPPSRRHFLQTTAAAVASLVLPRSTDRTCWFLHADTLTSWPVGDPVQWSLDHAH